MQAQQNNKKNSVTSVQKEKPSAAVSGGVLKERCRNEESKNNVLNRSSSFGRVVTARTHRTNTNSE